ncbi:MAG: 50S ribosomal protein L11 methyltransferase [Desulfatibacillaceae bacterium]
MRYMEMVVRFTADDPDLAQQLIAGVFHDLGIRGVELREPGRTGFLTEGPEPAEPDCDCHAVVAYLPADHRLEGMRARAGRELEALAGSLGIAWDVACSLHSEEEWAHAWKRYFHPQRITSRVVVKPTWETYEPEPGQVVVEIDPGMAFGTGTHATTSLCIRMLDEVVTAGCRFLDVGTGSGILMAVAARLGAGALVGTDNDPAALAVARDNLVLNGVPEGAWVLHEANLADGLPSGRYDVVCANITADPVMRLIPQLPPYMAEGAVFVASGIITAKRDAVLERLETCGFSIQKVQGKDGWCAVCAGGPA